MTEKMFQKRPDKTASKPVKKIARRITPEYLHNAALYYLERYAASAGRVRRVLTNKIRRSCHDHVDQDLKALLALIDPEIERLTRVELIKDSALARQFAEGYRARGVPVRMIVQKLRLKNFDEALIETVIGDLEIGEEGDAQTVEETAARRYLERRRLWPFLRSLPETPKDLSKARQKSFAALTRLGYDNDVIRRVFKGDLSEDE